MRSNLVLKAELIRKFGCIADAADNLGIPAVRLSRVIHGAVKVRPEEKRDIAWRLQKSISELFPEDRA
jgi:hypothetical protein